MQRTMLNGEPIRQGLCPNADGVVPQHLIPLRSSQNHITVAVSYRDGAVLTFLIERATPIVDLMAMISRAGTVRKVVL
jgi:threonine synthase